MNNIEQQHDDTNQVEYATFWVRLLAVIIDGFVTLPIGLLILFNFLSLKSFPLMVLTTLLTVLYRPLMEWRYSATVGKMLLKIKVVNEDQEHIRIDQAFGRNIPWIINYTLSLISYFYLFQTADFIAMDSIFHMEALAATSPIETANTVYFYIFLAIMVSLIYDKRKQGIHDKIAQTFVVKVKR